MAEARTSEQKGWLRVLDVRPTLARGEHPLDEVLGAADALAPDGLLEFIAPFEPRPLMERLRGRGCAVAAQPQPDGSWAVRVARGALPAVAEWAELPAPEPLERVLEAVARLAPGAVLLAHLPRHPVLLEPHLRARGLAFAVAERPDGTALLWVRGA